MPLSESSLSTTQLGMGLIPVQEVGEEEPRAYLYQLDIIQEIGPEVSRLFQCLSAAMTQLEVAHTSIIEGTTLSRWYCDKTMWLLELQFSTGCNPRKYYNSLLIVSPYVNT